MGEDEDGEDKNNGDDAAADDADADDNATITAVSTSSTKSIDTTTLLFQYWPEDPVRDEDTHTNDAVHSRPAWYVVRVVLRWLMRQYTNWTYSYMNVILRKGATANKNTTTTTNTATAKT